MLSFGRALPLGDPSFLQADERQRRLSFQPACMLLHEEVLLVPDDVLPSFSHPTERGSPEPALPVQGGSGEPQDYGAEQSALVRVHSAASKTSVCHCKNPMLLGLN